MNINLEFLCLRSNKIKNIENLKHLVNLATLDIHNNLITDLTPGNIGIILEELPPNLLMLNLGKNPCSLLPDYRKSVVLNLEMLEELDEIAIVLEERLL